MSVLNLVGEQTEERASQTESHKLAAYQGVLKIISKENSDLCKELTEMSRKLAEAVENIAALKEKLALEASNRFVYQEKNQQLLDAFLAQQAEVRRHKEEARRLKETMAAPQKAIPAHLPTTPARASQTGQTLYSVKRQAAHTTTAAPEHAVNEDTCSLSN